MSQFPDVLVKRVIQPRKRQQITTIVPLPEHVVLDRMLALVRRFRREHLDIFHLIWGDVLSAIFNKQRVLRNNLMVYVPRSLLQLYVTDPELALIPPLEAVPWNP